MTKRDSILKYTESLGSSKGGIFIAFAITKKVAPSGVL